MPTGGVIDLRDRGEGRVEIGRVGVNKEHSPIERPWSPLSSQVGVPLTAPVKKHEHRPAANPAKCRPATLYNSLAYGCMVALDQRRCHEPVFRPDRENLGVESVHIKNTPAKFILRLDPDKQRMMAGI